MEDESGGGHGRAPNTEEVEKALAEIGGEW
jgi:hypothetical protein